MLKKIWNKIFHRNRCEVTREDVQRALLKIKANGGKIDLPEIKSSNNDLFKTLNKEANECKPNLKKLTKK